MNKLYKTTRLKLTFLYFGIIFLIVFFFSSIIIRGQLEEIGKFEKFQSYNELFINSEGQTQPIHNVISDVRKNLIEQVLLTDILILIIAVLASYYLSGETMKPIEETIKRQKEFIANASHEFKTPLTAITTEAEVLLRAERTNDIYKQFAKNVLDESKNLSKLTFELLNIAKSDSNNRKLNIEVLNLNDLIKISISKFKTIAKEKNIDIKFVSNKNEIYIKWDKQEIIQLVDILIDNSIKYNKNNGNVLVNLKKENNVELTIEDSGIGISKEDIDKIFNRFYRSSNDRHTKGFGLGLSIAKDIIKEMDSKIEIKSELNNGTKVIIIFSNYFNNI